MNINCNIIKDLLPSYIDNICSEETKQLVEEHLKECEKCKEYLESMKSKISVSGIDEKKAIKIFSKEIKKKRLVAIILSIVITLIFVIVCWIIFGKKDFIMPYEENLITVEEKEGEFIANVNTLNYNQCQVILEENYDGTVDVFISLYQSLIDKIYAKKEFKSFGYVTKCYKNYIGENVDVNWISEDNSCKMTLNTSNDVKIANIYYLDTREKFDIICHSNETDGVAFDMVKIWTLEEK